MPPILQTIGAGLMECIIYLAVLSLHIFEIFMVMYFGNEIKSSSNQLSYYLFESNWINQSTSCKVCVIIFGGLLKRPHQMVVGKVYPLTLETFTKVCLSYMQTVETIKQYSITDIELSLQYVQHFAEHKSSLTIE